MGHGPSPRHAGTSARRPRKRKVGCDHDGSGSCQVIARRAVGGRLRYEARGLTSALVTARDCGPIPDRDNPLHTCTRWIQARRIAPIAMIPGRFGSIRARAARMGADPVAERACVHLGREWQTRDGRDPYSPFRAARLGWRCDRTLSPSAPPGEPAPSGVLVTADETGPVAGPAPAPTPGERRLAHPPSDRYRVAAPDPPPTGPTRRRPSPRGVAIALVAAIAGAVADRGARRRADGDRRARGRRRCDRLGGRGGAPVSGPVRTCGGAPRVAAAVTLAVGAVALGQLGLWQYARIEGGVLPPLDYLGEVFGSLVPVQFGRRRGRRLADRPMSDEIRSPPPDRGRSRRCSSARSTTGGAAASSISCFPRLWFQHFTGTSWVAEDGDGRLVGLPRRVRQPGSTRRGVHPHGRHEPEPPRSGGLGRTLYERFFDDVRAHGVRRVKAITWPGNRVSVGFHRAMGFTPADGPGTQNLYGTPGLRGLRRGRRRPGRVQPGTLTAAGVSCSWSSRPKRAARSGSGTASTQRRSSASPSA